MHKVSYFKNVGDTKPKDYDLVKWLKSTIDPDPAIKKKIELYRETGRDAIKRSLPCVTISATLNKDRNLDDIKKMSGFICVDIDGKENPFINLKSLKKFFKKHPSVFYVGYSVSGNGIYVVIKISKKVKLIKYFKYLKKTLQAKGVIIDKSCKDATRLRFISYDKKAYLNESARTLKLPKKKKIEKPKYSSNFSKTNINKVEAVVSMIESHQIDITTDYNDWIKIAAALYNSFGETGRQYFHRISKFHKDYKPKKADAKFNKCMNIRKVSLSSLFYIANSYGIRY